MTCVLLRDYNEALTHRMDRHETKVDSQFKALWKAVSSVRTRVAYISAGFAAVWAAVKIVVG